MEKEKRKCPPPNWREVKEIYDPDRKWTGVAKWLKDFEDHKHPTAEKVFRGIMKIPLSIPFIRKAINNSVGGTSGAIFKYWENGNYQAAYETALKKLNEERLRKGEGMLGNHFWWSFMEMACYSLGKLDSSGKKEDLIAMMTGGPEPLLGYYVSTSFCYGALWHWEMGREIPALDLVRRARDADPTYEYAWYLLGSISFSLKRDDALSFLQKAIELEPKTWSMILEDPVLSQELEVLRSLKEKALTKGIALKS